MSDNIELVRGTKIDDQGAAKAAGWLGILLSQPPSDSVEGQFRCACMTQCPYCGNVGWTDSLSSNIYSTVICGRCGMAFRV
jgi:hypothetical protein